MTGADSTRAWRASNVLLLLLVLGYPRFPGTNIPLCGILLLTHARSLLRMLDNEEARRCLWLFGLLYAAGLVVWLSHGDSRGEDLAFLSSIFIKSVLSVFIGFILAGSLRGDRRSLLIWIVLQAFLIAVSTVRQWVFDVLIPFAGSSGFDVYSNLFGQRAVGFGIIHVYGVIVFLSATFYYAETHLRSAWQKAALMVLQGVSLALSRTGIPVLVLYLSFFFWRGLAAFLAAFMALSYTSFTTPTQTQVVANVLELGRNYMYAGQVSTVSTDATFSAWAFPRDLGSATVGYGRFFESGLFFMGTDIGYCRVALFGGYFFLALFILANLYCALRTWSIAPKARSLALLFIAIFLIENMKGLGDISIFAYVLLFSAKNTGRA